jgi:hypothetical protein
MPRRIAACLRTVPLTRTVLLGEDAALREFSEEPMGSRTTVPCRDNRVSCSDKECAALAAFLHEQHETARHMCIGQAEAKEAVLLERLGKETPRRTRSRSISLDMMQHILLSHPCFKTMSG